MLPYTGEAQTSMATLGFFGLALAGLLGGLGLKAKKKKMTSLATDFLSRI